MLIVTILVCMALWGVWDVVVGILWILLGSWHLARAARARELRD